MASKIKTNLARMLAVTIISASMLAGCSGDKAGKAVETAGKRASSPADTTRHAKATNAPDGYRDDPKVLQRGLPRMVDLGKDKCIPCKMMAPILKDLKQEYEGTAIIEVIDLNEEPGAAKAYGVRLIPTQVFFNADGDEVWRHEGFLPKDAIVEKLLELGVGPVDR